MECFCNDLTARTTAKILSININTINAYFKELRIKISDNFIKKHNQESGKFKLDKIYSEVRKVRGKRARGAAEKPPVFGLLKRNGEAFVTVVYNCSKESVMPVFRGSVYYSQNEFSRKKSNVNGIECFWSFAKRRLAKFNESFVMHLK